MLRDVDRLTGQAAAKDRPAKHEAVWPRSRAPHCRRSSAVRQVQWSRPCWHQHQIGNGCCIGQTAGETRRAVDDEQVQACGAQRNPPLRRAAADSARKPFDAASQPTAGGSVGG
jgi:hypothetical protein